MTDPEDALQSPVTLEPQPPTEPETEASLGEAAAARGPLPGDAPPGETPPSPMEASASGTAAVIAIDTPARRRRLTLLVVLFGAAVALLLFSAWYLVTRKPISELPLPGLTVEAVPSYSFSVYGVTRPTGVAVSADGERIYVTQTEADPAVLVFDGKGNRLTTLQAPPNSGSDHVPVYVAINPLTGDLYVSDRPAASVYVYSRDGDYLRTFETPVNLHGWQPLGLAFNATGDLFVTDVSGPFNRVHQFAPDGALVRSIGEPGQFSFPNGIAVDAAGNLYVADSNNGRLVVFDASGRQRAVVRRGPGAGDLGMPRGTTVDDLGRLYVVDTSGQVVKVYHALSVADDPPAYIGQFGTEGVDDGAFHYPNGVAADARARIYVADWDNNRVQVWTY